MEHSYAREGVRKIYNAEILSIVSLVIGVLSVIPLVGVVFAVIAGVIGLVSFVISLSGTKMAGKDEDGYNNAHKTLMFVILIAVIAIIVGMFAPTASSYLDDIADICNIIVVYFVMGATLRLLNGNGNTELAKNGNSVWTFYAVAIVIGAVASLLSTIIPATEIILSIVSGIFEIVAYLMYLSFLKKAYPVL